MTHSIITGTGSYIPPVKVPNRQFLENEFYQADGTKNPKANTDIVDKLQEITCIRERRYIDDDYTTSDMAYQAAEYALEGMDRETLDYIIVGQNLGDVKTDNNTPDMVPTIAARVKHKLKIKNPYTVAYDIPFGPAVFEPMDDRAIMRKMVANYMKSLGMRGQFGRAEELLTLHAILDE